MSTWRGLDGVACATGSTGTRPSFGVGPAYLFIIQHRLPVGLMCGRWRPWLSAMATNVAIAAVATWLAKYMIKGLVFLRSNNTYRL